MLGKVVGIKALRKLIRKQKIIPTSSFILKLFPTFQVYANGVRINREFLNYRQICPASLELKKLRAVTCPKNNGSNPPTIHKFSIFQK